MKKINILTQPLYVNYGGILQNYALQETLRNLGFEPLTLNVPVKKPLNRRDWKDYIKTCLNSFQKLKGCYYPPFLSPTKRIKKEYEFSKELGKFAEKYISKVNVEAPFSDQIVCDYPAEAWIVGSDQVWRPWCSPYIENCFFDFLQGVKTKRISYAASFGTDKWEIPIEKVDKIKPLVQLFDAISVREGSGVGLAKEYLGAEAFHVLDPTLLLTKDDYLNLIPETLLSKKNPKLVTYILDPDNTKRNEIKKVAKQLRLQEKKTGIMHKDRFDSIEEWLAAFATADAVITDSFHGTVFSIIFDKPFKVLKNPVRGNTRLNSLLSLFPHKHNDQGFLIKDTDTVQIIDRLRQFSINWLNNSIRQIHPTQ